MGVIAATATDTMSADGALQKQTQVSKKSFHFLAGLGSGLFTAVLLQPADLLKTRVQQRISSPSQYPATLTSNLTPGSTTATRSTHPILATLREILASPNPIKSLWRGTVPSAVRTGAGSALYFGGLNVLRAKMAENGWGTEASKNQTMSTSRISTDSQSPFTSTAATPSQHTSTTPPTPTPTPSSTSSSLPKLSHTANLLSGAVARAGAGFVMMPVTVIKVRFESSLYNYTSLLSASTDILRKEGARGFFAGFGATAVRDAPYAGLYVFFYEYSKAKLNAMSSAATPETALNPHTSTSSAATINFTSGMLAATFATAATNPFDAIKTRLQLEPAKYKNMMYAFQKMIREEGPRCMMDGLALRMGRKAISSALAWTAYEEIIRRAERRFVETKL